MITCLPLRPATVCWGAVLGLVVLLAACDQAPGEGGEEGGAGGMFGGPAPVGVVTVQPQSVPLRLESIGRTQALREAQVRARVEGTLLKRSFVEGEPVKAGQTLFVLDPEPFEAALARAEAVVVAAQARLDQARREVARLKPLYEENSISRRDYDDAVSLASISQADLLAAQAALEQARLELRWSRVAAPISGISGRALVSEGSLVSGSDQLLTTVTQLDPIQVLFGLSDAVRLQLRRELAAGRLELPADRRFEVRLRLADDSEYAHAGKVDFLGVQVSGSTATSEVRAELPNPEGELYPGQFVRVRVAGAVRKGVFLVPQRAVLEGPQGKFVYVINGEDKADMRPVQVAEWHGSDWLISDGLQAGDRVVVEGTMKLYPGAPVAIAGAAAE